MKVLVIVAEPTDTLTALPAIRQVLDYQGTPYTVFVASPRPADPTTDRLSSLLASGCTGFYQGVILGNGQLAYNDPAAGFQSALTDPEWQALWNYENTFRVRQVTWYTYPTEEYGFQPNPTGTDTSVTPISALYTPDGHNVFPYANTANPLTIRNAWTYLARPLTDSTVLLADADGNALSVVRTYPNGTQNLAMTFDSNPFLLHDMVLAYGVVNWAVGGLFLGERGIFLTPQTDDVFLDAHVWSEGTPCGTDTEQNNVIYRITGQDLQAVLAWQNNRHAQSTTAQFRLDFPFNGEGTTGIYNPDTLTPAARANQAQFKWTNHTFSHENLDNANYSLSQYQIAHNIEIAQDLGLTAFSARNLVTPDVSGLENAAAMQAAFDAGVRYVVTDTSRPGYDNPAPNLGIYNQHQPAILMIPRHPNNLFYNVTNPAQWTEEYNCLYRSFWGRDLTYSEILDNESQALLRFMLIGDMDPLMFHQTNLRAYDGTHTLLTDLLDRMFDQYGSLVVLPVLSPTMDSLGAGMANRMAYTSAGVSASLIPGRQITLTATRAAIVPVTGLRVNGFEIYGGQPISHVSLAAGQTLVIPLGPVAANDSYSVGQGQTLNISAPGVLGNDTDSDGNALTAVRVSGPSHGTLTLNADGSFTYSHDGSGTQTDTFTYTARDTAGATSNVATVSITVTPINHPPVAANDSYNVGEGQTLNISAPGVLGNDADSDGDALTAVRVSGPSHGTLTLNANGSFTYSHDGSETLSDSFTYKARDVSGATSSVATVSITVSPINDPPVARNDSYSMGLLNLVLTVPAPGVLANDTDAEGDALTAALVTGPSRGTLVFNSNGSLVYTPSPSLSSFTDTFTYRVRDGVASSNIATVTIQVNRGL